MSLLQAPQANKQKGRHSGPRYLSSEFRTCYSPAIRASGLNRVFSAIVN